MIVYRSCCLRYRLSFRPSSRYHSHPQRPTQIRRHTLPIFDRQQHQQQWNEPDRVRQDAYSIALHWRCKSRWGISWRGTGCCSRCFGTVGGCCYGWRRRGDAQLEMDGGASSVRILDRSASFSGVSLQHTSLLNQASSRLWSCVPVACCCYLGDKGVNCASVYIVSICD